jgi:hypothetical protein
MPPPSGSRSPSRLTRSTRRPGPAGASSSAASWPTSPTPPTWSGSAPCPCTLGPWSEDPVRACAASLGHRPPHQDPPRSALHLVGLTGRRRGEVHCSPRIRWVERRANGEASSVMASTHEGWLVRRRDRAQGWNDGRWLVSRLRSSGGSRRRRRSARRGSPRRPSRQQGRTAATSECWRQSGSGAAKGP